MKAAIATLCVFATYMLFAGTISLSEAATGVVLSGLGAASVIVFGRISDRRFHFSFAHIPPWGQSLSRVPVATAHTAAALARTLLLGRDDFARAVDRPFRQGARNASAERARRATAVLAASLAPDRFVVCAELGRDSALVHGLDCSPVGDSEWLV